MNSKIFVCRSDVFGKDILAIFTFEHITQFISFVILLNCIPITIFLLNVFNSPYWRVQVVCATIQKKIKVISLTDLFLI